MKKAMLATTRLLTLDRLNEIEYPVYVTPKLDGIRCMMGVWTHPGGNETGCTAFSRTLKPLPNLMLQDWAENEGVAGFDGEIIVPNHTFHEIQSWVMSRITFPRDFIYYVFDSWMHDGRGYLQRVQKVKNQIGIYNPSKVILLEPYKAISAKHLQKWFETFLGEGYEGAIVRTGDGPYKEGRATWKEQYMLKMKEYEDYEAVIIDFEEAMENTNEQTRDALGKSKRSKHKAGLRGKDVLGALVCRDCKTGEIFNLGSGFDDALRWVIWSNRPFYKGKRVLYKSAVHGVKDKPRTPIFKAIVE